MTRAQWVAQAAVCLAAAPDWRQHGVEDNPRTEAIWLLCAALEITRAQWLTWPDAALTADEQARLADWLSQRVRGLPLARLTGWAEFWSLPLQVSSATLLPRADTETLVSVALAQAPAQVASCRVVDLGTGSGAVALALKSARPDWQVTAVDACPQALAVAAENGRRLGLPVRWLQSDWLLALASEQFEMIVSNPPYLAVEDPHLPALWHEPRQALVAAAHGLADFRRIAAQALPQLVSGGWLLFEHGADQADAVCQLLREAGFAQVQSWRDLSGHVRVSGGCRDAVG